MSHDRRILAVGATSFIATGLSSIAGESIEVHRMDARACLDKPDFTGYDVIVNCALNPLFKTRKYEESLDVDLQVARRAARAGAHFVMLSSRKVYGVVNTLDPVQENHPTHPVCFYGANKLDSEWHIRAELPRSHTVLRAGNVFGFEPGRDSFLGVALTSLKRDKQIVLDASPFVQRDFIPVHQFCRLVLAVCNICPVGTFNIGSSVGTAIGRIGLWLIGGYGDGTLVVTGIDERDQFVLDTQRLHDALGTVSKEINLEYEFQRLGEKLRNG